MIERKRLEELMNNNYDGDCETFDSQQAAFDVLEEIGEPFGYLVEYVPSRYDFLTTKDGYEAALKLGFNAFPVYK